MRAAIRNILTGVLAVLALQIVPIPEPIAHQISIISEASAGGHGNALTPFTVGFDGWTVIGSTAGTGQANCGSLHNTTNPGTCWYYVASAAHGGSDTNNDCTIIGSPCLTILHATNQMREAKPDHLNIYCGDTFPFNAVNILEVKANTNGGVGVSSTQPAVYTTYCPGLSEGAGPRPVLQAACNPGLSFKSAKPAVFNYAAIINLRFYWNTHDPVNNPGSYDPTCQGGSIVGMSLDLGTHAWILLEGNTFEYSSGTSLQSGSANVFMTNLLMRRNIVLGSWSATSANGFFSEGISLNGLGTDGTMLLEENIFAQNGWNTAATTPISTVTYNSSTGLVTLVLTSATTGLTSASTTTVSGVTGTGAASVNGTFSLTTGTNGNTLVYSVGTGLPISGLSGGTVTGVAAGSLQHCVYINYGSDNAQPAYPLSTVKQPEITIPVIYKGNLTLQCADSDQIRNGGEVQFNAWVGNPGCASIGGPIVNATDNLCTEGSNLYVSNVPNGSGFDIGTGNTPNFTTIPTRPQTVTNNIFNNNHGTNQSAALNMQGLSCNPSLNQCTLPSTNFLAGGNLACGWTGSGGIPTPGATDGAILTLNSGSLIGGSGGAPGVYPGIRFTGGSGTGAIGVVVVGAGGGVASVNITQFGGVGALFTGHAASGVLTVTDAQAGSAIVPNNTTVTTSLVDAGNSPNGVATQITSQLTNDPVTNLPNGNGTYAINQAGLTWDSIGAIFTGTGSGVNLTVSAIATGKLRVGGGTQQVIVGSGAPPGTTISSQTSGVPGGVGVYVTNQATTSSGDTLSAVSSINGYPTGQSETLPFPSGGLGFVGGDTLTIPGGSSAGQVPSLSGATIQVATVARNDFTTPTTNTVQTSTCAGLSGPNPTITVASYDAAQGGAGTITDYVNSVLSQHKSNLDGTTGWFYKWSAYAIVNAFKAGFGQPQNAPVYSP